MNLAQHGALFSWNSSGGATVGNAFSMAAASEAADLQRRLETMTLEHTFHVPVNEFLASSVVEQTPTRAISDEGNDAWRAVVIGLSATTPDVPPEQNHVVTQSESDAMVFLVEQGTAHAVAIISTFPVDAAADDRMDRFLAQTEVSKGKRLIRRRG